MRLIYSLIQNCDNSNEKIVQKSGAMVGLWGESTDGNEGIEGIGGTHKRDKQYNKTSVVSGNVGICQIGWYKSFGGLSPPDC